MYQRISSATNKYTMGHDNIFQSVYFKLRIRIFGTILNASFGRFFLTFGSSSLPSNYLKQFDAKDCLLGFTK